MHASLFILADNDGGLIKLVFFVIVIVGGWIFNAIKKWQQGQQPMPSAPPIDPAGQLEKSVEAAQQRLRLEQANRQRLLNPAASPPMKKARRPAKRQAVPAAAAPIVRAVAPPPPAPEPAVAAKPIAKRVTSAALHSWLTPATLKQQFVLTEILNPPKALRPDA